jgi:hypothetical protein
LQKYNHLRFDRVFLTTDSWRAPNPWNFVGLRIGHSRKTIPPYMWSLFAGYLIVVTFVRPATWIAQNNWTHKPLNPLKPSIKLSPERSPFPTIRAMIVPMVFFWLPALVCR